MTKSNNLTNKELEKQMLDRQQKDDERMSGIETEIGSIKSGQEQILKALEGMSAKSRPVASTSVESNAADVDLGSGEMSYRQTPDGEESVIEISSEDIESPRFKAKADKMAFDKEMVTIRITDTAEANADRVFDVAVNGRRKTFVRGETYTVQRMYVEALCRAKPVHYGNEEYEDRSGVGVRHPMRRGLRYAFEVLEDKNPAGKQWLAETLSAA